MHERNVQRMYFFSLFFYQFTCQQQLQWKTLQANLSLAKKLCAAGTYTITENWTMLRLGSRANRQNRIGPGRVRARFENTGPGSGAPVHGTFGLRLGLGQKKRPVQCSTANNKWYLLKVMPNLPMRRRYKLQHGSRLYEYYTMVSLHH